MDSLYIHRSHFGTQLFKCFAVCRRDIFSLLRSDLTDLYKGRSEILKDINCDLRRNAVIVIVFPQNRDDFLKPSVGIRLGFFCIPALLHQGADKTGHFSTS